MLQVLYIGVGGFLGAIARFLISRVASRYFPHFPYGTLVVNVLGSFLLGLIIYSILHHGKAVSPELRAMINIGFIGAFTTMSTFAFETTQLFEIGQTTTAVLNILANVGLCLLAVAAGRYCALVLVK